MNEKVVYSERKGEKTSFCNINRPKINRRPLNRHELEAPDDLNANTLAFMCSMTDFLQFFSHNDGIELGNRPKQLINVLEIGK
ncbi:hypothetical protein TNCT_166201 [Trichonephila clavata]|uniref:Uncharacterized protein n=1 Tax=Trichonephila clavata TaxID=2740835 RepID=A0A8X6FVC3_TRICU|nr:hypothetical protein TNCT_166201 [Trichonephila clavata]